MEVALGMSISSLGSLHITTPLGANPQPKSSLFGLSTAAQRHCSLQGNCLIKSSNQWLGSSSSCSSLLRAIPTEQEQYVDYNSQTTVFPAEACEELGGEFCGVEGVGDEVKPTAAASAGKEGGDYVEPPTATGKDLEYLEYNSDKTVFPGEACDELGGNFCEPEYQKGVFPEKTAS